MYQNIFITSRTEHEEATVYIWDDTDGLKTYPYRDFDYAYLPHERGDYISMFGERLKRVKRYDRENPNLLESDLSRETRVLSDLYLHDDTPSKNHRVMVIDLEVSSDGGFASVEDANKEITAIAIYSQKDDQYIVFLLNKDGTLDSSQTENEAVLTFATERELLETFLMYYQGINPTILTGWNLDGYDIPYLIHRLNRVFGKGAATRLSPIGRIKYNQNREMYQIAGVALLDYLKLYKKYTYNQRPSYRLDAIAKAEIGQGKTEYVGSLDTLYATDIKKFIEYNLNDVKLVVGIDKKMQLIELIRFICHIGHVPYEDFGYSSKFIEGTIITYLHRKGIICPNKPIGGREAFNAKMENDEEGFAGAFVKEPKPGLYEWVYSLDLQSLYPSIIMSLNISPDTKIGRVRNWDVEKHLRGEMTEYLWYTEAQGDLTMNRTSFDQFMAANNFAISSNGILYAQDKIGVIPEILDVWFKERVEYKTLMKKYVKEGNQELADFYDRRQHVQKILLNSIYGVLGLSIFRFYDIDNALAVTATGQDVIKTSAKFLNGKYVKETGVNKDYCVYIDTDSVYFSALPLLTNVPETDRKDTVIKLARTHETALNDFYAVMAKKLFNVSASRHRFIIKGESVMDTGFWVAKKRYAMNKIYDLETNKDMPDGKLAVKGLDVVRSSFPPAFANFMSNVLKAILKKVPKSDVDSMVLEFREELPKRDYLEIARNTSVKNLSKYDGDSKALNEFAKGAPAHVKAAIAYNRLLRVWGVEHTFGSIRDGDKIKWVYLKTNPYKLDAVAIKTYDDPPQALELVTKYIDYDQLFEKELVNKLEDFYGALSWGMIPTKLNQTMMQFFSFD